MAYRVEAIQRTGAPIDTVIEAGSAEEAARVVRDRGMMPTRIQAVGDASPSAEVSGGSLSWRRGISAGDRALFAKQMHMLTSAGAPIIAALSATAEQAANPRFAARVRAIRDEVESGGRLSEALGNDPQAFGPVYGALVGAGEATGRLDDAFAQLAAITERRMRTQRAVIGAMVYPALLAVLALGVVTTLILFVVPRFRALFDTLGADLPASTAFLFSLGEAGRANFGWIAGLTLALIIALVVALRMPRTREQLRRSLYTLPVIGKLLIQVQLARVLQLWGAMLSAKVPLMEVFEQSKASVTSPVVAEILDEVTEVVAGGGRVGDALGRSKRVPPVVARAISTGEEHGRLAESVAFVASWLDDENVQKLTAVTRLAEPVMLIVIGLAVGGVALALFVPLFDIALAAG